MSAEHRAVPPLAVAVSASAADGVPLGIARIDPAERLVYANGEMLRIAGLDSWHGRTLADVFRGEALQKVRDELRQRIQTRKGNAYLLELTRPDAEVVPISVTSFPELDTNGAVIGSVAVVRDLTVQAAQQRMYKLVERESDTEKLLDAIGEELHRLVPFDRLRVIRLNERRTHLRTIYPPPRREGNARQDFRWWRIPDALKPFLNGERLRIDDMHGWYQHPDRVALLAQPAVQKFLAEGFTSILSLPITQNGCDVASIVLSRREGRAFTEEEEEIAEQLPLTEAASVALRHETVGNLQFLIELMGDIASAYGSVSELAQTVVRKIASHYDWDYVSLYQVHEDLGIVRLVAQQARSAELEETRSEYPIDGSIVGRVFLRRRALAIANLADRRLAKLRVKRKKETLSELCVPVGRDARWLLNIEDEQRNAFAPEEKRDLVKIAGALQSLLERTVQYHYRSAVVTRANDAIFLVNARKTVFEANAAAVRLLDIPLDAITGRPMADFFVDSEEAQALLASGSSPNHQVFMKGRGDRAQVKVLLSVAKTPDEIATWIFVASDMTLYERAERLELAQDLYREIAGQVKTPMSLAISWLRRVPQGKPGVGEDLATKAMQQLRKAELTLDRLMLMDSTQSAGTRHEVLISMDDLVRSIWQDLPEREQDVVWIRGEAGPVLVRADVYELRYGLETVLSFLLRLVPEDDRIDVELGREGGHVLVTASGYADGAATDLEHECRSGQARAEISLGHETLVRLAVRNRGAFTKSGVEGDTRRASFRFAFPAVREGARA